jgi:Protein of unknown function (DUF2924)
MPSELCDQIQGLRQMTTRQLRGKYRELFGQDSHSNHKDYLFRRVAWRLQAVGEGGLSERARQWARDLAQDADLRLCGRKGGVQRAAGQPGLHVAAASRRADPRVPVCGTRLVKQYHQQTLTVTVLEEGFQYGGRVYKSLSAIAREVTGTQWNGYVFFGLTQCRERPNEAGG